MNKKLVLAVGSLSTLAVLVSCSHVNKREVASVDSNGKKLGVEVVPPTEEAATKEVLALVKASYNKPQPGNSYALRIIHGKQHGCVRGEFKINSDIPEKYRFGVFAEPGSTFPAWARLSNGSGKKQHDSMPDARGLAIKLMEVKGAKLADEKGTQDLLFQSKPVFFASDVQAYVKFMKFTAKGGAGGVGDLIKSTNLMDPKDRKGIQILATGSADHIKNPLTAEYFSALPQRLGSHQAMKMKAYPCPPKNGPEAGLKDQMKKDYLNMIMTEHLASSDACVEVAIQLQTDAEKMPIEDATVAWDPALSPFVPVAQLIIPKQSFSSEKRQDFCEHLAFNPWHSIEAHRPIGGLNRVRKLVYEHSQHFRHDLNNQRRSEPQANESYE
ncbi:catalase family protein [Peredibacter starrii]|uniref:catalase n=1 Tax=Peredibacter starrii TaxID=28202 RepID=A0AAX4HKU5_9BACT|nr:catalase family protein [Peredibacter starrii]WPU63826.1 catalase family protein [Peredibacter starrii]